MSGPGIPEPPSLAKLGRWAIFIVIVLAVIGAVWYASVHLGIPIPQPILYIAGLILLVFLIVWAIKFLTGA